MLDRIPLQLRAGCWGLNPSGPSKFWGVSGGTRRRWSRWRQLHPEQSAPGPSFWRIWATAADAEQRQLAELAPGGVRWGPLSERQLRISWRKWHPRAAFRPAIPRFHSRAGADASHLPGGAPSRTPTPALEGPGRRGKTCEDRQERISFSLSLSVCACVQFFFNFFQCFSIFFTCFSFYFPLRFPLLASRQAIASSCPPPSLPSQRPAVSVHIPHPDIASKLASSQMPVLPRVLHGHARLGSTARPRRIWPD